MQTVYLLSPPPPRPRKICSYFSSDSQNAPWIQMLTHILWEKETKSSISIHSSAVEHRTVLKSAFCSKIKFTCLNKSQGLEDNFKSVNSLSGFWVGGTYDTEFDKAGLFIVQRFDFRLECFSFWVLSWVWNREAFRASEFNIVYLTIIAIKDKMITAFKNTNSFPINLCCTVLTPEKCSNSWISCLNWTS